MDDGVAGKVTATWEPLQEPGSLWFIYLYPVAFMWSLFITRRLVLFRQQLECTMCMYMLIVGILCMLIVERNVMSCLVVCSELDR